VTKSDVCDKIGRRLLTVSQVLWVLVMFYGLGAAASDYFCPSLSSIADYLRMSPDVAISFH